MEKPSKNLQTDSYSPMSFFEDMRVTNCPEVQINHPEDDFQKSF
jgi:hypothetical protein